MPRRKGWEQAAQFLEELEEYEAAGALRRELDPDRPDRLAAFIGATDAEVGARWQLDHSDAGLYLHRQATVRERKSTFLGRIEEVRAALEQDGRWSESYEWRIGTEGTDAIEKHEKGFRISVDHHGVFVATSTTFAGACEKLSVLSAIQKDLFYVVGWASWAGRETLDAPADSELGAEDDVVRYRYLARISREARTAGPALARQITQALAGDGTWRDVVESDDVSVARAADRASRRWGEHGRDGAVVAFSVSNDSLALSGESPTAERAAQFLGIYTQLQIDLRRVLAWE